jgi:ribosome-associated protein
MPEVAEDLVVNRSLTIPASELRWRFSATGGPGGQHANTSNTKVVLTFEVQSSNALTGLQRQLILDRLGPVVRVAVTDERSQSRNRELALRRLRDRLREALTVRVQRRATAPTRSSVQRRLEDKRQVGRRKSERREQHGPED